MKFLEPSAKDFEVTPMFPSCSDQRREAILRIVCSISGGSSSKGNPAQKVMVTLPLNISLPSNVDKQSLEMSIMVKSIGHPSTNTSSIEQIGDRKSTRLNSSHTS